MGKTTVAVNLALALSEQGRKVGLADADLYAPDVPRMMGLRRQDDAPSVTVFAAKNSPGSRLEAVERHGIQIASAGFLLGANQALGVHGGIAQLIVRRLVTGTAWLDLDCLVVDLPPGTADIQQFVFALRRRTVFVLVVVTPQLVAHQDARRLITDLARHQAIAVGGVENMTAYICPHCGRPAHCSPPRQRRRASGM